MKRFAPVKIEKIRNFRDFQFYLGIYIFIIKDSDKKVEPELLCDTMSEIGNRYKNNITDQF